MQFVIPQTISTERKSNWRVPLHGENAPKWCRGSTITGRWASTTHCRKSTTTAATARRISQSLARGDRTENRRTGCVRWSELKLKKNNYRVASNRGASHVFFECSARFFSFEYYIIVQAMFNIRVQSIFDKIRVLEYLTRSYNCRPSSRSIYQNGFRKRKY
jgi:hypothetical protein